MICEICGRPLETSQYIRLDPDGAGVHDACLVRYLGGLNRLRTAGSLDVPRAILMALEDHCTAPVPLGGGERLDD